MRSKKKVVTIGGGTGSPIIIQALIKAGIDGITAISAAMDSGGRTGAIKMDERGQVISVGDLWRTLLALLPPEEYVKPSTQAFTEMISYTDGRWRNVGYTLYYALLEKYQNNYVEVQALLEQLLGVRFAGSAIPITLRPTTLCFRTASGSIYYGEHELDKHNMSTDMVDTIWCDPLVSAQQEALKAIRQADYLIYCPGSLYGSVLSNFLPEGVSEALKNTRAHKVLITNLVTTRNETHGFNPIDYWDVLSRYSNLSKPIDLMITPELSQIEFEQKYPLIANRYQREHAYFLGWQINELREIRERGVKVIRGKIYHVTERQELRHNEESLANLFSTLLV